MNRPFRRALVTAVTPLLALATGCWQSRPLDGPVPSPTPSVLPASCQPSSDSGLAAPVDLTIRQSTVGRAGGLSIGVTAVAEDGTTVLALATGDGTCRRELTVTGAAGTAGDLSGYHLVITKVTPVPSNGKTVPPGGSKDTVSVRVTRP